MHTMAVKKVSDLVVHKIKLLIWIVIAIKTIYTYPSVQLLEA